MDRVFQDHKKEQTKELWGLLRPGSSDGCRGPSGRRDTTGLGRLKAKKAKKMLWQWRRHDRRANYLRQRRVKKSISIQKQRGWSGVTSEARVKCSACRFQSDAAALLHSRCECFLTDVAGIERDASVLFWVFLLSRARRSLWLVKKVSSALDEKICSRFRSRCIALTVWAHFLTFKQFKQISKKSLLLEPREL